MIPPNITQTDVDSHTQNLSLYEHEALDFSGRNSSLELVGNSSLSLGNYTEYAEIPYYIKATSMTFCIAIMCLGVVGNVLVPVVILKTKDMRNSTNIFLVNLSIADLLVLLVCTPTVLVEVGSRPETWLLGKELCLAVPFVELTVTHASVLTILAISFERYYAICEPLRAGYVCTKTRAALICALVWFFAALFTSPILGIAEHSEVAREDGSVSAQCLTAAASFWPAAFFLMVIVLLYLLPLVVLLVLYSVIARSLVAAASSVARHKSPEPGAARARRQVVLMLGTVVLCFFLCLLPYRALALWIIVAPPGLADGLGPERWYGLLYFSRVMLYLNSAINPILYNLMSSKFRGGFWRVCACSSRPRVAAASTTSSSLTRTTTSLKKFFHRGSVERATASEDVRDEDTRSLFGRIFSTKTFVRQQSAPVCSPSRPAPVVSRQRSEGALRGGGAEGAGRGSLRRSVLLGKARSIDCAAVESGRAKLDCVVAFQKSRSLDHDLPESFV